jgi:hypothetical protein
VIGRGCIKFAGFVVVHHKNIGILGSVTKLRSKTGRGCQAKTGLTGLENWCDRFGGQRAPEASRRRTRVGITRLAARLHEVRSRGIRPMVL